MGRANALRLALGCGLALLTAGGPALGDDEADPRAVLEERCRACHQPLNSGSLSRIGEMRKTPEGWDRSIQRMQLWHGVEVSDVERAALVKFLSDTRGLAPEEAARYRYGLEQRPDVVERGEDPELAVLCARCHSFAHFALQRRTRDEWLRLAHTHAGQWPTIEYQDKARDRRWWQLASERAPDWLVERYPLESEAWTAWQRKPRWSPAGEWRVHGTQPGGGDFAGTMRVQGDGRDRYRCEFDFVDSDGASLGGSGTAIVYTGFEWRGSADWGEHSVRQVWALEDEGKRLQGRWFLEGSDSLGGELSARRVDVANPQIVAVLPSSIRAGERKSLTVHGSGLPLDGNVSLGEGIIVTEVLGRNGDQVRLVAHAAEDLREGSRDVRVGAVVGKDAVVAYRQIAALRVEPPYAIARVGGGPIAAVPAQFEAIGFLKGPDGKSGTKDDVEIGRVDARWKLEPFDELAAEMSDVDYAGTLDARGRFEPAAAGPNKERRFGTNNVGRLRVVAAVDEGEGLSAAAELVVTVQRWVDPIIR